MAWTNSAPNTSQRLVVSGNWDLPFGRKRRLGANMPAAVDYVLGGWQVSGIVTLQTGIPIQIGNGQKGLNIFSANQRASATGIDPPAGGGERAAELVVQPGGLRAVRRPRPPDPGKQAAVQAFLACGFLIFIAFIAYQGEVFRYPGSTNNSFLSWLVGLLNGYLFAGSIWYYLAQGQWPLNVVQPPYSQLYTAIYTVLPPAIFKWQYLIALVVIMIILRVIR